MTADRKKAPWPLTEKEKQTLRLMVRGHDAKSIAIRLDLSVHTINERLRDARRKMSVSSSREAARLLLEVESGDEAGPHPDLIVDNIIGGDCPRATIDQEGASLDSAGWLRRHHRIIIGVFLMTLAFGLLALVALSQGPSASAPTTHQAADIELADTARQFLTLIDQGRWEDSYRRTGRAFQKLNTLQVWTKVSQDVRPPLGAVISRTVLRQDSLPVPPHGMEMVKFQTRFANKDNAVETVTLDREGGQWRVVGVMIE